MGNWWADEPAERQPAFERRYPGRIKAEIDDLSRHGRVLAVREDFWKLALLAVDYEWRHPLSGSEHQLRIIYPSGFPRVRPDIILAGEPSSFPRRHCDPLTGALCYLGHSEHEWRPNDSIAVLIDQQLPKILDASFTAEDEEPVPEPAERWWNCFALENSAFLIDSTWSVGGVERGTLRLAYTFADEPRGALRAVVTAVFDDKYAKIADWDRDLPREFHGARSVDVPWERASDEIYPRNPREVFLAYRGALGARMGIHTLAEGIAARLFAVVHPTELEYGRTGDSWILFMSFGSRRDFALGRETKLTDVTVRTMRAGRDDLTSRSPASEVLHGRNVVVAGVGAIGAPVALEFARNGAGELSVADVDRVIPGNSVRWPIGETAWGVAKAGALRRLIERDYSNCRVHAFHLDIGDQLEAHIDEARRFREKIEAADVVIDATTSFGVLGSLYDFCCQRGVAVVSVSATPPLTGGSVVAYSPSGGCPTCLLFHYQELTSPVIPPRGEGEVGNTVTPLGCAEVTFTGASFDLSELSLQAVRVAVHMIKTRSESSPAPSVVFTLTFHDTAYGRIATWDAIEFDKHASCNCTREKP